MWRKLGLVLKAAGGPLGLTHAMLPTPLVLSDRIRVFFASCDADLRGRVFFADLAREPPHRVLHVERTPVLDVGAPGDFDCDGVNPSQLVVHEGQLHLLYIGWRRSQGDEPYTLLAGLAAGDPDGRAFRKLGAPLLPASAAERLFRTAPFVARDADGWRMLYIAGDAFVSDAGGKRVPVYELREMRSPSLFAWPGEGRTLLSPNRAEGELGFGRPVLTHHAGAPMLMISVRTEHGYRLVQVPEGDLSGRAFADVLSEPAEAWEREMTCFGAPCRVGDRELLFYNGDGFGRSGMGLAWRPAQASATS